MIHLLKCPFCGGIKIEVMKSGFSWKTSECGEYVHYVGFHEEKDGDCYKAVCDEASGGCGAEIGGDSEEEAISKWNKRK